MADIVDIVHARTADEATRQLFASLLTPETMWVPQPQFEIGDWAKTVVYDPDKQHELSISPPFMEAFLEIQRQLYQFVAFVQTGVADSKLLSAADKENLVVYVRVTGGSSTFQSDVGAALKKAIPGMLKKLNGRQVALITLTVCVTLGAAWSFSAWLETQKEVQLQELRSREHIAALTALSFAQPAQVDALKALTAALEAQGKIGERALIMLRESNDALLKAASKSNGVEINGQKLASGDAQLLRLSARKAPTERLSIERIRVVGVNTKDDADIDMVLMDERDNEHRVNIAESLFARAERPEIFAALANRTPIWAELLFREVDGEVKSVTFLRLAKDPSLAER